MRHVYKHIFKKKGRQPPKYPKFYFIEGTPAHGSLDVFFTNTVCRDIRDLGFEAKFLGTIYPYEFPNGDIYRLRHTGRGAWKYSKQATQGDLEEYIIKIHDGHFSPKTKGFCVGHRHTNEGTVLNYKGMDGIYLPGFVGFISYPRADRMEAHYQPDIGFYLTVVTSDGRTHWFHWLYQPYDFVDIDNKVETGKPRKTYTNVDLFEIEGYVKLLLDEAIYVAIFVSDTHIGEKVAPAPEKFEHNNRNVTWSLTKANYLMNSYWYHMMYLIRYVFKPDEIFHLGDCVAGMSIFERYRNPLSTNLEEESKAHVALWSALKYDKDTLKKLIRKNIEKSK